jgi:hypothetical protein
MSELLILVLIVALIIVIARANTKAEKTSLIALEAFEMSLELAESVETDELAEGPLEIAGKLEALLTPVQIEGVLVTLEQGPRYSKANKQSS